jgi:hypothetical protein
LQWVSADRGGEIESKMFISSYILEISILPVFEIITSSFKVNRDAWVGISIDDILIRPK